MTARARVSIISLALIIFALVPLSIAPASAAGFGVSCSYDAAAAASLGVPKCDSGGNLQVNLTTSGAGIATASGQPALNGDGGGLSHITNWPTTQAVSGTVSVGNTVNVTGTFTGKLCDATTGTQCAAVDPLGNQQVMLPGISNTGTLGANNATITVPVNGMGGLGFNIAGAWVATITTSGSFDGGLTYPDVGLNCQSFTGNGSTYTANQSAFCNVAGLTNVQFTMTPYTSGTATINYHTSIAAPYAPVSGFNGSPVNGSYPADSATNTGLNTIAQISAFNGTSFDRVRKEPYANGPNWATTGGSTTTRLNSGSATACTNISNGKGRFVSVWEAVSTEAVTVTFYDEGTSPTCVAADIIGTFANLPVLSPSISPITLNEYLANGLSYKLSGALTGGVNITRF